MLLLSMWNHIFREREKAIMRIRSALYMNSHIQAKNTQLWIISIRQEAILRQKDLIRRIYENGIVAGDFLNRFREHPQIEELNHRLLVSLIDRILIYEDKTVDIVYRYTDEMQKCASILNNAS